jgi:hypothetical protein
VNRREIFKVRDLYRYGRIGEGFELFKSSFADTQYSSAGLRSVEGERADILALRRALVSHQRSK